MSLIDMEDAFDNMFSTLQRSDEMLQENQHRCKEVKERTEKLKTEVEKLQAEFRSEMSRKDVLEQELAKATVELKLLQSTAGKFTSDLDDIKRELKEETVECGNLLTLLQRACSENSEKMQRFSNEYGISSGGTEKRECLAKDQSKELEREVDILTSEIHKLGIHLRELRASLDQRSQLLVEVLDLEKSIADEEGALYRHSKDLISANQRHLELSNGQENGEDFLKLERKRQQSEYESNEIQSEVRELQSQLKRLTEQLKRKEGHALQSQYRNWQVQRHQQFCMSKHGNNNSSNKNTCDIVGAADLSGLEDMPVNAMESSGDCDVPPQDKNGIQLLDNDEDEFILVNYVFRNNYNAQSYNSEEIEDTDKVIMIYI